jgi:hypothetical protein
MFFRLIYCVLASSALAPAAPATVEGIDILGFGEYRITKSESFSTDTSPSGRVWIALPEIVTANVDIIEARLGVNFGFHYLLKGSPTGEPVQIRTVIVFPPPGITNREGKRFKSSEYKITRTIGGQYSVGYGFSHSWEIVGGDWTIQLWHDDSLLAQKVFHVIIPGTSGVSP